jgi:hypothetical protein
MPERSKVMTQTKRHPGPPEQGVGHAAGDRTLEKTTLLRRLKTMFIKTSRKTKIEMA